MKTKIVYTLVSSEKDIYLEQLWVSIYSLRLYNSEAHVIVLVDDKTNETLTGYRAVIKELANEIIVVETPQSYTPKERSREIKTSIRKHVKGDFLFLDTDTVICDQLDEIDNLIDMDIAIVSDFHVPFSAYPFKRYIVEIMREIFDTDVSEVKEYFNSGAMYVRDTERSHLFFDAWNKNWTHSAFKKGNSQDQPALMKTNYDFNSLIKELDGSYNCQIAASIKYLHEAKVIHFFNARFFGDTNYSPFFRTDFYLDIRKNAALTACHIECIANCKNSFEAFTTPIGRKEFEFLTSPFGNRLNKIYQEQGLCFKCLDFFLKVKNRIIG